MYKPHLTVSESDIPDIKNWQVDSTYSIVVKVKMKGIEKRPDYSDMEMMSPVDTPKKPKEKLFAEFEIEGMSVEDDGDFEEEYAKKMKG